MYFTNTEVYGFRSALRGMRMPLQSFSKSDSSINLIYDGKGEESFVLGYNDTDLAKRLIQAGPEHSKFLRMIDVWTDISMPQYVASEFDTYKIGTTRNSSSFMHLGMKHPFTEKDFAIKDKRIVSALGNYKEYERDCFEYFTELKENLYKEFPDEAEHLMSEYVWWVQIIRRLNYLREEYNKSKDKAIFEELRCELPSGYLYTFTWSANYAVLRNMYFQRRNHRLTEWNTDFVNWIKSLPYSSELITYEGEKKDEN